MYPKPLHLLSLTSCFTHYCNVIFWIPLKLAFLFLFGICPKCMNVPSAKGERNKHFFSSPTPSPVGSLLAMVCWFLGKGKVCVWGFFFCDRKCEKFLLKPSVVIYVDTKLCYYSFVNWPFDLNCLSRGLSNYTCHYKTCG